jgi:histidinol phosphatase-like enzyme
VKNYKLIIFDIDGTLVEFNKTELLPGVAEKLKGLGCKIALASNQGGPACRDVGWPWSHKYPTMMEVNYRLNVISQKVGGVALVEIPLYTAWAFVTKDNKVLYPKDLPEMQKNLAMRKPQPGMLFKAIVDAGVAPGQTLMVGDSEEDKEAARNANNVDFIWAKEFFGS